MSYQNEGSGKTTIAHQLSNESTMVLSLDDFYLPFNEMQEVFKKYRGLTCYKTRGYPETIDVALLSLTLGKIKEEKPLLIKVPVFDKSLHGGLGDRLSIWRDIDLSKIKTVILEGWCVLYNGVDINRNSGLLDPHSINIIQEHFMTFSRSISCFCDCEIKFKAEISYAFEWRLQQEHQLINSKGSGMSDEQVLEFVSRFQPAYELFDSEKVISTKYVHFRLDKMRKVIECSCSCGMSCSAIKIDE
ncbi:P-loop containing nucleoside triphosphate hydrolase protein [Rozella allomycis CSF55]|uniref:P-loop containing nucleoside triphosphate hydrolase protein n=1 Tax=Rozella allomycis (strain CSF55) TaxID=988480 RepID=A0A4P9YI08_ROZAC|nr:P-loop containing nucleoside triphosphate hydrolase protein [Rozella allomycis CSF55]